MSLIVDKVSFSTKDGFDLNWNGISLLPGSSVAVIGKNGSGKTSLLECILGLKAGARATGTMGGIALEKIHNNRKLLRNVGFQIQGMHFPFGVKVKDVVSLHDTLYQKHDLDLREILAIDPLLNKKYWHCSVGEKLRVELFFACAHRPNYLFFDEPTRGLDQATKDNFVLWIKQLFTGNDKSVCMLTSHAPEELKMTDSLIWLDQGKEIFSGSQIEFKNKYLGDYRLDVCIKNDSALSFLKNNELAFSHRGDRGHIFSFFGDSTLKEKTSSLLESEPNIIFATVSKNSPTDVFDYVTRS
ncbi:MAG: ABC-2 type transport system ATP-binding protein [Flavobacteriales bacterium]|jgi:ABC-2 type transport system ATP-binding protein